MLYSPYIGIKDGGGAGATVTASGVFSGGVSTFGNTAGTTGVVTAENVFVGGSNITLSQSAVGGNATITIIGPAAGAFTGSQSIGISNAGNDLGSTGYASGSVIQYLFEPGLNMQFSQSLNGASGTLTIIGAAYVSNTIGMSNLGNTAGTSGVITELPWKFFLAGGNNITLSQSLAPGSNSATITIVGPTQSAQPEGTLSIGMSNLGNTSGTTGIVTGTGPLYYFAGGNNITLSQSINGSSGTLTIIGAAGGTGGGSFLAGQSTLGNSSGDATVVSNQLVLAGGNNITLSGSTNGGSMTITISAPSGGGAGVSSGGNTAGTTGTVDVQLVFVGGSNISLSQSVNGGSGTITINGATAGGGGFQSAGISTNGNTAGTTGFASSQMLLVGGSNITLSQSINLGNVTITINGATAGGGQTAISGIAGSAASTVTAGTVQFQNSNGVSFGLNGSTMTASIANVPAIGTAVKGVSSIGSTGTVTRYAPEDHQHAGVFSIGMSTGGNTVGTTAVLPGQMVFAGVNNITLSQSTAAGNLMTLSISGPTGGGAGMSTQGNTAGTTGTVGAQLVLVGGSNISLSQSINGQSATLTINGASGGGAAFSAGVSTGGNTLGTTGTVSNQVLFVGSNNITLSQSSAAGGATITISGPTQTSGAQSIGMSNLGNTSGTTGMASGNLVQFAFAGSNNITLSQSINGASGTITVLGVTSASLVPADIVSSVSSANASGTQHSFFARGDHVHAGVGPAGVSTGGNTAGTTTVAHGQIVFAGGANITLSQSADASNRMTVSVVGGAGGGGAAIGVTNTGNTAGTNFTATSGTVYFQGTNNITVSNSSAAGVQTLWFSGPTLPPIGTAVKGVSSVGSTGTITRYAPEDHQHAGVFSIGISTGGNTSGTTAVLPGQMVFAGGSNITLSQSSAAGNLMTLTIVGPTGGGAGISTGGNTAGTSGTVGVQLVLVGGNAITLSGSTAAGGSGTITINAGAGGGFTTGSTTGGGFSATLSTNGLSFVQPYHTRYVYPIDAHMTPVSAPVQGGATFRYVDVLQPVTGTRIDALVLWAGASTNSAVTGAVVISAYAAIYTRNASTLSSLSSGSTQTTYTYASNTAGNTQLITAAIRPVSVPVNFNIIPGEYIVGFNMSTNSSSIGAATTNLAQTLSMMGIQGMITASNYAEFTNQTAASTGLWGGQGVYSSNQTGLSTSPQLSAIVQTGASLSQANIVLVFRNA